MSAAFVKRMSISVLARGRTHVVVIFHRDAHLLERAIVSRRIVVAVVVVVWAK